MKQFFGLFFIQAIEFETKLKIIDREKNKNSTDNKDSEDQKFNIQKVEAEPVNFHSTHSLFQFDYHLKRTEPKPIQPNSIKNRIKLNGAQTNGNLVLL